MYQCRQMLHSRLVTVTVADRVPLEVGVAVVRGEGVDDMRAVIVDSAAAVGFCKLSCSVEVTDR